MNLPKNPFFSNPQRKCISFALTTLAFASIAFATIAAFLLLQFLIQKFTLVLVPPLIAALLALLLKPAMHFLKTKFHFPTPLAAISLILSIDLLLLALAALVIPLFIDQALNLYNFLLAHIPTLQHLQQQYFPDAPNLFQKYLSRDSLIQNAPSIFSKLTLLFSSSMLTFSSISQNLSSILNFLVGTLLTPIYLFFFLSSQSNWFDRLHSETLFIQSPWKSNFLSLSKEFLDILIAFFRGQLLICFIDASLLALLFSLIGLQSSIALALIIGLFNVIPFFGTLLGSLLLIPISLFQPNGGLQLTSLAFASLIAVILFDSYWLTPKIVGKRAGLHPCFTILSLVFWSQLINGPLGLLLAIPLSAFALVLWKFLKQQFSKNQSPTSITTPPHSNS